MRSRLPFLLVRLLALVALAVSSALLLDYSRPIQAFCAPDSGCDKVRLSGYGSWYGVPVPVLGIVGFGSLFVLSLFAHSAIARRVLRVGAVLGGVGGVAFLLLQAIAIHAFCHLCFIVDIASIGIAACALLSPSRPPARSNTAWSIVWATAGALSVGLPFVADPVPPELSRLWQPGMINVVEFADFQCPFCRQLHPSLNRLLQQYGDRVRFVRLNMPLAMHPQARDAARAYCCADDQGKGHPMADALFASGDLSPSHCEQLATSVGVSLPEYRACVAKASTDARIDSEMKKVRAVGLRGLPTVWIGDQVHIGWRPGNESDLESAFEKAAAGHHSFRIPLGWLWVGYAVALLALAVVSLRIEPGGSGPNVSVGARWTATETKPE